MERRRARFFWLISCALVLVVDMQVAFAQGAGGGGAGRARIESPMGLFNFGKVAAGAQVENYFPLRNRGDADLIIQRVLPGCGCTSVGAVEAIPPGQERKLRVVFDSNGFSGPISKTVRVFSNDESRPYLDLVMEGEVLPDVVVNPPWVRFNDVVPGIGAEAVREVRIEAASAAPVKLGEVKSFSPYLTVRETAGDEKSKQLQVRLSSDAPIGELRDRITVQLSGEGLARPVLNIPVFATVVASVKLEPKLVSFGMVEGEAPITRTARLVSLTPEAVAVEGHKINRSGIEAVIEPEEDRRAYRIVLTLDPNVVKDSTAAALEIFTDRGDSKRLVLQIQAVVPYKP